MNIASILKADLIGDDVCYVGRSRKSLGYANPWSHQWNYRARFKTNTPAEARYRYKEWFLDGLVAKYIRGLGYWTPHDWEREYFHRVLILAKNIKAGNVTTLVTHEDINIENYILVPDGLERYDVEILVKGLLRIIDYLNEKENHG